MSIRSVELCSINCRIKVRNKSRKVLEVQMAVMKALPQILMMVQNGESVRKIVKSCGLNYMDYWKYSPAAEREQIGKTLKDQCWRQRRRDLKN